MNRIKLAVAALVVLVAVVVASADIIVSPKSIKINDRVLNGMYIGNSTSSKPTLGVDTGTLYLETDTGMLYAYDGSQWKPTGHPVIVGTSADTKPTTGVMDGTLFVETDTGRIYDFNSTTNTWLPSEPQRTRQIFIPVGYYGANVSEVFLQGYYRAYLFAATDLDCYAYSEPFVVPSDYVGNPKIYALVYRGDGLGFNFNSNVTYASNQMYPLKYQEEVDLGDSIANKVVLWKNLGLSLTNLSKNDVVVVGIKNDYLNSGAAPRTFYLIGFVFEYTAET